MKITLAVCSFSRYADHTKRVKKCIDKTCLIGMRLFRILRQKMFSVDGLEGGLSRLDVFKDDEGVRSVGQQLDFFDETKRFEKLEKVFVRTTCHQTGVASKKELKYKYLSV
jgi:hypothetical protein